MRFYLTATAPETRDTELALRDEGSPWEDFIERNNNELVATWGNAREDSGPPKSTWVRPRGLGFMLSFAYRRFDGVVPEPGELDDEDRALLERVEAGFEIVGDLYNACKFRAALGEYLALAGEANGYLDRKAPWFQIKEDPQAAATSVYVILRVVDNLKTILAPILPHTPVHSTGHRSCTSTWATRGSSLGRSTWSSTRRKPATAGCAATRR